MIKLTRYQKFLLKYEPFGNLTRFMMRIIYWHCQAVKRKNRMRALGIGVFFGGVFCLLGYNPLNSWEWYALTVPWSYATEITWKIMEVDIFS